MGDIVLTAPQSKKISGYNNLIEKLTADPSIAAATSVLSSQGILLLDKGNVRAVKIWGIEVPRRNSVVPFKESLIRQKDIAADPSRIGLDGSPTRVVKIFSPPARDSGEILTGSPAQAAAGLIERLEQTVRMFSE